MILRNSFLRKLFYGVLFVSVAKVFMSYILRLADKSNVTNPMNRHGTPDRSGKNIDKPSFYMVGWLTSLAQEHLKIVKTDDAYARYSSDLPSYFYLIRTSIADKDNLKTVGYINQAKDIVFDVYVHRVGYCNTKYNQLLFWFKDKVSALYRKAFRKKAKLEKEFVPLSKHKYLKLYFRSKRHSKGFRKLIPSLEELGSPLYLRFELLESLPCGICQFRITPISPLGSDPDNIMAEVDEVKKFIFDQIHPYFHQHHFCQYGLKANEPILHRSVSDIATPDNENVRHFIESTKSDLVEKLDDIYKSYRFLLVNKKIKREKGQKKIGKKKLIQTSWSFFNDCDNLLGIHAFLSTLLNSPRNKSIKIGPNEPDRVPTEDQETAMLIESSYRGTIALMQKISHHEDFRNQRKSMIKAKVSIRISVIFSVISILMSLYFGLDGLKKWVDNLWDKIF